MSSSTAGVDGSRRSRRRGFGAYAGLAAVAIAGQLLVQAPGLVPGSSDASVSAAPTEPVAFEASGTGNGHGRGLSQWGAYGRAVNGQQSWQTILDAYYGGTSNSTRSNSTIGVRLTRFDNAVSVGALSSTRNLRWAGASASSNIDYRSVQVTETAPNTFDVYGLDNSAACPSALALVLPKGTFSTSSPLSDEVKIIQTFLNRFGYDAGPVDGDFGPRTEGAVKRFQTYAKLSITGIWAEPERVAGQKLIDSTPAEGWLKLASGVTGPIKFTSTLNTETAAPADVIGVCQPDEVIVHYRGSITVRDDSDGNHVVNSVPIDSYLRGVVPREVPASWGSDGGGLGMNALRAQAVAARGYALAQNRYAYAQTCDTPVCQAYGGAAKRTAPAAAATVLEAALTDTAIRETAGVVRVWPNGNVVSTEYSASNGPRTAGGMFPPVDDPYDKVPGNQYHTWTRTIPAFDIARAYTLASTAGVKTEADPGSPYDGIWANRVRLTSSATVSAWDFRNEFDLPSPGFTLKPVFGPSTKACMPSTADTFAMIGDSVGVGVAGSITGVLRQRLDAAFTASQYDVLESRPASGGVDDGVAAAGRVPQGTEIVVVELGYNDKPSEFKAHIDRVMEALKARSVGTVIWTNMSVRRSEFAESNAALQDATSRWANLRVADWSSASASWDSWFTDGVHLTADGNTGFAAFVTQQVANVAGVASGSCLSWKTARLGAGKTIEVPVLGRSGVPASLAQVKGVALNITSVQPNMSAHLKVWECGQPEPDTSSINDEAGTATPNLVLVPLSKTGRVCIWTYGGTDVVVDLNAWFDADSGMNVATGRYIDTRTTTRVQAGTTLRVPLLGKFGLPATVDQLQGAALNIIAVRPSANGHLTVWECEKPEPTTSSVNYLANGVSSNAVVLPLSGTGTACIKTHSTTDIVVDVSGYFDTGADIYTSTERLIDTRLGAGRLAAKNQRSVAMPKATNVPGGAVGGVVLNVTAVQPDAPGHLTVWKCGPAVPPTSAVNYLPGRAVPNAALLSLSLTDQICVWTFSTTDLVVDSSALFGTKSGLHLASARLMDTRVAVG